MKLRIISVFFILLVLSCQQSKSENHFRSSEKRFLVCNCDTTYVVNSIISIRINEGTFNTSEKVYMVVKNPKSALEYAQNKITLTDDTEFQNLKFENVVGVKFYTEKGEEISPRTPFFISHKMENDKQKFMLKKGDLRKDNVYWHSYSNYLLSVFDKISVAGKYYGPRIANTDLLLSSFLDSSFRNSFSNENVNGTIRFKIINDSIFKIDTFNINGNLKRVKELILSIEKATENLRITEPKNIVATSRFIQEMQSQYVIVLKSLELSPEVLNNISFSGYSKVNYAVSEEGWYGIISPTVEKLSKSREVEINITIKNKFSGTLFLVNKSLTVSFPIFKKKNKFKLNFETYTNDDSIFYLFESKENGVKLIKTIHIKPGEVINI